jgi:riboflavin transporter FmnP
MGVQILLTSSVTQWLLWQGETRFLVFIAVWAVHVALIPPIILFVHRRGGGQRTATELYIWWIWASFILCCCFVAVFNQVVGLPVFFTAPMLALLAASGFSTMAMVTHRFFLIHGALFLAVMVAMTYARDAQFLIFGVSWMVVLVSMGIYFRATRTAAKAVPASAHAGRRL